MKLGKEHVKEGMMLQMLQDGILKSSYLLSNELFIGKMSQP
jgi:hypothetical protein